MRTLRPTLVLLLGVLIPASLSAQQSTTPAPTASDPQAVVLLQKSLIAMTGGLPVTDATLTGTARLIAGSDDETGTSTLKATSLGDSRVDLVFPSGNRSEIRNHSSLPLSGSIPPSAPGNIAQTPQAAGAWIGPDGAPHPMASHNVMTDAVWFFPAITLAEIASQNYVLSYVGQETLGGQSVVHVSASRPFVAPSGTQLPTAALGMPVGTLMQHLSQVDLYFDPITSLPVVFCFNVHPDANALVDIPARIEFSNYQRESGIQVPLHLQKFMNNGLVLDLQFTNASLNSGLGATPFQLP